MMDWKVVWKWWFGGCGLCCRTFVIISSRSL